MMLNKIRSSVILITIMALILTLFSSTNQAYAAVPQVWIQNAADRAFQSSTMPANATTAIQLYSARNEYEAAQILVRSPQSQSNLFVTAHALTGPGGATIPTSNITVRHEYSHTNVWKVSTDYQNPPDGSSTYTDALIEQTYLSLPANVTQPYWYSVYVPASQPPGTYTGTVTVNSSLGTVNVPVSVKVYNVTIPPTNQSTFKMNNWFSAVGGDYRGFDRAIELQYNVTKYSPQWWTIIGNIAENHAKHRNNVIFTDFQALLIPSTTINSTNTSYNFDWTFFDAYIQEFIDAGAMQYIQTSTLLEKSNGVMKVKMLKNVNGVTTKVLVDINTPESNQYMNTLFAALKTHLDAKGWTNKFYVAAYDEPSSAYDIQGSNWLYNIYKSHFPNPLIVEAHHIKMTGLENKLSTFVPVMNNYEVNMGYYQTLRINGKELWLYNCIIPQGEYMNRFISFHLDKTRLTPWLAWKVGASGYLHWGWNYWVRDNGGGNLVALDTFNGALGDAGDHWLVRPNKAALDIYDSVRSEAQLDGLEDVELLNILKAIKPLAAESIAATLITNSVAYTRDGKQVVARHKQILDEIVSAQSDVRFSFTDDFSSGNQGNWVHTLGSWTVSGGEYNQTDLSTWKAVAAVKGRSYGDFALTFDTKIVNDNGNSGSWAGAMIRSKNASDLESGYLVGMRNNGEIHLWRSGTTLAAAMVPGYTPGQYITIKVVAKGSNIQVFAGANRTALINYSDTSFSTGHIGLATGATSAKFDNVVINAEQNYAEGKTVVASSSHIGDGWAPQFAVDGRKSSISQFNGYSSNSNLTVQNHNESITVDFGKSYPLSRVDLYPRNDGVNTGYGFPIDFTLQTSTDNVNWTTVVTKTGQALPGNQVQSFTFASVNARYVKVNATKLQLDGPTSTTYRLQLAEIQAIGGNLAAGKTVTASSSYENTSEGWAKANATDGARLSNAFYSMGWTSDSNKTVNHSEWVTVDLGGQSRINHVNLFPNSEANSVGDFFPIDFTIQTSTDNVNWTTVVTRTGYSKPDHTAQSFSFTNTTARYVRVNGTNLRFEPHEGTYRMGFAEIEVR